MRAPGIARKGHPPGRRARLLFVEDDPSILELQLLLMKRLGYEVLAATDGEEALAIMLRERPDVVVLDVMLPGCDGFSVARRMRQHPALRRIPVAFVSARRQGADFSQGFAAGGQIYLAKPFTTRSLQTAVETLLNARLSPSPTR